MVRVKEGLEQILADTLKSGALIGSDRGMVELRGVVRTKLDESIPVGAIESGFREFAKGGGEEFVIDDVELRRDVASPEVEDLANGSMVVGGEAKVHATARALSPLRELLVVLELGVENECRTSPNARAQDGSMLGLLHASEELDRGQGLTVLGKVVPNMDGVGVSKRP